jgi:hypothetical protein
MYIDRKVVAEILSTEPVNVRSAEVDGDRIRVRLWNPREDRDISLARYQNLKGAPPSIGENSEGKSVQAGIGVFFMVVGAITVLFGASMDATVYSGYESVYNIGLVSEKSDRIHIGGTLFLSGAVLVGTRKRD